MSNRKLLRDETGVAAMEYALIVALIAVGIAASLMSFGTATSETYETASGAMAGSPSDAGPEPSKPPRVPTRPGGGNRVPR